MGASPTYLVGATALAGVLPAVITESMPVLLGGAAVVVLVGYVGTRLLSRFRGESDDDASSVDVDSDDDEKEFSVSYTPIDSNSEDSWTPDSGSSSGSSTTNGGSPSSSHSASAASSQSASGGGASGESASGGGASGGTSGSTDASTTDDASSDEEEETGTDTRIFTGTRSDGTPGTCPDCQKELPAGEEFEFCPFCGREL